MLEKTKKDKLIKKFKKHDSDTGSPDVQIAILTEEIAELTGHLKTHAKDHSSRRGLLRKIGQRRRLMRYMSKDDPEGYDALVKKLKLKPIVSYDLKGAVTVEEEETEEAVVGSTHDTA